MSTFVVYFTGPVPEKDSLPKGEKVRLCNAKYFDGTVEMAGTKKRPGIPHVPVWFDECVIGPGVPPATAKAIEAAYSEKGVEVAGGELPPEPEKPKAKPVKKVTAKKATAKKATKRKAKARSRK